MATSSVKTARNIILRTITQEEGKENPNQSTLRRLKRQLENTGAGRSAIEKQNQEDDMEGRVVSRDQKMNASIRLARIKDAAKAGTLDKNPDVLRVTGRGAKNPDVLRVTGRGAKNPDAYNELKPSKDKGYFPAPRKAKPTDYNSPDGITVTRKPNTSMVVPTAKSTPPRRPTVGGNMIGGTPPGGGTLSKKDADEYGEAFASPDADKMYKLSEKSRRSDMNMLERALEDIAKAGDRATADRRKRGISDYADDNDIYGSRKGGSVKKTVKNKKNKRAALRGFGVETRGS